MGIPIGIGRLIPGGIVSLGSIPFGSNLGMQLLIGYRSFERACYARDEPISTHADRRQT
jgi:hypothetical protein